MRIFISYSRVDRQLCVDLASRLRRVYGYESVWFDETLHAGEVWWQEILDQVRRCDIFLIMMTRETFESEYCQAEYKEAKRLNKSLLPVLVRARTEIPDHLKHIQYVDMGMGINADNLGELYAAVQQLQKRLAPTPVEPTNPEPTPKPVVDSAAKPSGYTAELSRVRTMSRTGFIFGGVGFVALAAALVFVLATSNRDPAVTTVSPDLATQLAVSSINQVVMVPTSTPVVVATSADTPLPPNTATPTPTNTETPTITPTLTNTASVTPTFTDTATPTLTATITASPTITPSVTPSDTATSTHTPTITPTIDIDILLQTLDSKNLTATATRWTETPTPNITASIEARLTQRADTATALAAANQTATATLWTATPTPTFTPTDTPTATATFTLTPTITPSPTITPTSTPTLTLEEAAFALAVAGVVQNSEWHPYTATFNNVAMVLVPAGCFDMGSNNNAMNERPSNPQCFDEPFWIDLTEITNAQFGFSSTWGGNDRAHDSVDWRQAADFCQARGGRLPTEREWEYAARGPDGLIYPWGDTFDPEGLVYSATSDQATANVGSRLTDVSWVGALDMAGNVREWTESLFLQYPYVPNAAEGNTRPSTTRSVRGGGYRSSQQDVRTSFRTGEASSTVRTDIGFRCARDFAEGEN